MLSLCWSQWASRWTPSTYSITRYGSPASLNPASSMRVMLGWSSDARMCCSRWNRSTKDGPAAWGASILSADRCTTPPASRSARYTEPRPPEPRWRMSVYGPGAAVGSRADRRAMQRSTRTQRVFLCVAVHFFSIGCFHNRECSLPKLRIVALGSQYAFTIGSRRRFPPGRTKPATAPTVQRPASWSNFRE